jgi:DNA-directed RNA polymerase III subunit RPC1
MRHQAPAPETLKEQVVDTVPKRIRELKFGILSTQDIANQAVLEVCDRSLFDLDRDRAARINGPLDGRMGLSKKGGLCETCGQDMTDCVGHFGHVRLPLPVFHVGYFKMIITILQEICKVRNIIFEEESESNCTRNAPKCY